MECSRTEIWGESGEEGESNMGCGVWAEDGSGGVDGFGREGKRDGKEGG